jgi:membrane-associated phospholipid phosphatase
VARRATGALALAAVAASYLGVRTGRSDALDGAVARVLGRPGPPAVDRALGAATDLGSVYGLTGVAVALAASGRRRASIEVLAAGGVGWAAAQAVKPALHRPRPYESDGAARLVAVPAGSSWPSGHAAVGAAMATALWPQLGPAGRAGVVSASAGIGLTRLHVGVHHATDVVAGLGVGVLSALGAGALLRRGWS